MKTLDQNTEVQEALQSFNLWGKEGRNSVLLFSGTYDECEEELKNEYDDHPDYEIAQNTIADQWENPVSKIGYVKMANDNIIEYSI